MQFTMGTGGVPAGSYQATFIGAEPYLENVERYGEGVALKWRIAGGEHNGAEASRICSAKLTPKSTLGTLAVALAGRAIAPGEAFDFATYAGTRGSLLVEATEKGGSRVSVFLKEQAPPQPVASPSADGQQL